MFDFKMPSMGADMESGILVQWNFAIGDRVEKGDVICEIETAKGNIDVEIWEGGVLSEILVEPGEKVPVGEVLARLDSDSPAAEPPPTPTEMPASPSPTTKTRPVTPLKPPSDAVGAASPAARRRAAEHGIALSEIVGSGPGGVVKLEDVERATAHPHRRVTPVARKMADEAGVDVERIAASGVHDTVTKSDVTRAIADVAPTPAAPSGLREAIAKAMTKSKREIPHYYLKSTIDVSDALKWMAEQNASRSVAQRLVFGALVAKAVALAARDVPEMNGFYDDGFRPGAAVHLGFAVSMRGGGVVAPAIHDTAEKPLDEVMSSMKDVVRRVRGGKLRSSEMMDPTLTLTSLGDAGVDTVFGVIYPPQVAIVGFGSPRPIPFATDDGMIGVHMCADITLSGDHRVSDGLTGARFLKRIQGYLETPEQL